MSVTHIVRVFLQAEIEDVPLRGFTQTERQELSVDFKFKQTKKSGILCLISLRLVVWHVSAGFVFTEDREFLPVHVHETYRQGISPGSHAKLEV